MGKNEWDVWPAVLALLYNSEWNPHHSTIGWRIRGYTSPKATAIHNNNQQQTKPTNKTRRFSFSTCESFSGSVSSLERNRESGSRSVVQETRSHFCLSSQFPTSFPVRWELFCPNIRDWTVLRISLLKVKLDTDSLQNHCYLCELVPWI